MIYGYGKVGMRPNTLANYNLVNNIIKNDDFV